MTMMKNPVILLACSLLLFSLTVAAFTTSYSPDECCFQFISKPLPKKSVVAYKFTDTRCPKKGVLFTMKSRSQICADPTVDWVMSIIKDKDKMLVNNVKSSEPKETN